MSIFDEMEKDAASFSRAPTTQESQDLTRLGLELMDIESRLVRYAEVARALEERKRDIQMRELVDAMDAVGQDVIGLPDQGVDLKLDDYFKAGLPNPDTAENEEDRQRMADLRAAGIAFLTEDAPDILSTELLVKLPKGSLELAERIRAQVVAPHTGEPAIVIEGATPELLEEIRGMLTSSQGMALEEGRVRVLGDVGFGVDPARVSVTEGVHWATLTSYVKEQIRGRKRADLPLEALGATVGRIVKIVKRKRK